MDIASIGGLALAIIGILAGMMIEGGRDKITSRRSSTLNWSAKPKIRASISPAGCSRCPVGPMHTA